MRFSAPDRARAREGVGQKSPKERTPGDLPRFAGYPRRSGKIGDAGLTRRAYTTRLGLDQEARVFDFSSERLGGVYGR